MESRTKINTITITELKKRIKNGEPVVIVEGKLVCYLKNGKHIITNN